MLLRMLTSLVKAGITQQIVVVGYAKDRIEEFIAQTPVAFGGIHFCFNPDYTKGSILSLWSARSEFDDDLLIMDADVLFADALLYRLLGSSHGNALLLDPRSASTGEEMLLMAKQGRVLHIGRHLDGPYDQLGEGVGFLKLSHRDAPLFLEVLESLLKEGREGSEYEEAIDRFLQKAFVGYELVGDLPWTEIDFPEDIEKAEKEILPRL